jgi:hypothetical protein
MEEESCGANTAYQRELLQRMSPLMAQSGQSRSAMSAFA